MSDAASGAKLEAPAPNPTGAPRQRHRPLTWLLAGLLVLTLAVPVLTTIAMGPASYETIARSYPGAPTALLTTLARIVADVSSLLTAGALVSALFLGRGTWVKVPGGRSLETTEWFETFILRRAAGLWLLSSLSLVMLEAADSNGLPISRMADPQALQFALFSGDFPRAWMLSTIAAAVCWGVGRFALRWVSYLIALWACMIGVLAPVVVGHVLVGPQHDFGGDAAVYQTVLLHTAFGALVVLTMRLASGRRIPRPGRSRWWGLLVVGLGVFTLSEIVIIWFKLAGSAPWDSATGWFSLVRLSGLALVAIGLWLGRSPGPTAVPHRAWLGLAACGVAIVVTAGIAMTRIPPPQFFVETSISQIFLGFDLPDPPSFVELTTGWRPNVLFGVAAVVGIGCYLAAVHVLRRRGISWPLGRTIPWVAGWLIVLVTTSSGFGKYSGADFAVHMGVHMTLNMVAPIFLVLGGPITLALRTFRAAESDDAPGPREWITAVMSSRALNLLYHPLLVFGLYIGSYYALYFSGAFGNLMRFHWAHQLMNAHFLIVGCLYFGLVVGVDKVPRKLPHIGKLGFIMAAMPFHAFFGVILMSSGNNLIGENFYRHLDQPWATDLERTQYIAGGVAWAGGEIPLLIVVIVLALQWAIQDNKDARRIDRRLDSRADNEHAAYNDMLQRIGNHDARVRQHSSNEDSR